MGKLQIECTVFRRKKKKLEFLLLKRILKKGGFWQPPCGGVKKEDKSKLNAAYRELSEETSIPKEKIIRIIKNIYFFKIDKHYITGEPIHTIKEYVYGFEVHPQTKVSIYNNVHLEHKQFKWVYFNKALKMLKWNNNKEAFKKLNRLLNKKPNLSVCDYWKVKIWKGLNRSKAYYSAWKGKYYSM